MNRSFINRMALAAGAVTLLASAGGVKAAMVTETYKFDLSNFVDIINSSPAPIPTVTGSFKVTFDPLVSVSNQTTGFTFTTTPALTSDSPIGFTVFGASSPTGDAAIAVGGTENGANLVAEYTNDPIVFFNIPNASMPANASLEVCSQPGFRCGNYSGNSTVYASGYALGNTSSIFFATKETVAAVPEPATWAMMLVGFGALGAAMRNRRRTGTATA